MTQSLLFAIAGTLLGSLLLIQAWLLWRLTRVVASAARVEEKVTHLADALSLLTETTESGFRAVAGELGRRHDAAPVAVPRPAPSMARLKAAVRRGRSVSEIAAAESMSEGEVRLRMHLAGKVEPALRNEKTTAAPAVPPPAMAAKIAAAPVAAAPSPVPVRAAKVRRSRTEPAHDVRA
jgi:hypothetical protein